MSSLTVCAFVQGQAASKQLNILSVYLHPMQITEESLDDAIAPALSTHGPFDAMHLSGAPEQIATVRAILNRESAVRERLQGALHPIESKVVLITWADDHTQQFDAQRLDGSFVDISVVENERRFGLFDAFIKHGGLVNAGRGTHFTKPSGAHAPQFLRAANVLEGNAVTHQLVFWLYALLKERTINRIVVDTSGISTVAYGLAYERLNRGVSNSLPAIETHASYGGLDTLDVSDPNGTIFLVSASTSGKLVEQLMQKGALAENVFTLFFLGQATAGRVLCDLATEEPIGFKGIATIANHVAEKCPECAQHSLAIPIVGDQFRTDPARIEEIIVTLSDFDETSRANLDRLVSTGLFKVFRKTSKRSYEIYLDVEEVLTKLPADDSASGRVKDLRLRLDRILHRGMPVHLKRIVPTAYPGTELIANTAINALPMDVKKNVSIVSSQALLPSESMGEAATLVVSGCLDDTYELMAISRDLRTVQPGGTITYVSPFFRNTSEAERKRIESNLTFGDQGPKTFSLFSVVSIDIPHCSSDHSWEREYRRLQEVVYWCDLNDQEIPAELSQRIDLLVAAPANGMSENLFWDTPNGQPLRLAADFTMIPTNDGKRPISQADVFVIVASLFHKYRAGVGKKPKLVSNSYERTVISPESFQRFSDGVLQAAFLRAARSGEVAYGNCSVEVSARMLNFLCVEVGAVKNGGGPALVEFLIAMLVGRLTLHSMHKNQFLQLVVDAPLIPDVIKLLAKFMIDESMVDAIN